VIVWLLVVLHEKVTPQRECRMRQSRCQWRFRPEGTGLGYV